ncbi:MAG TPA: HlyD family secretion protein [Bryobacteraceae bacterium]|jgi:membrane fusion protein (multidrug efflux system)|nr:HlyD family secretion protein [Bryobacteraceae bacterium]
MPSDLEKERTESYTETTQAAGLEKDTPPARPKGKLFRVLLIGGVVLAAAATGFWLHFRDQVSTDDAQVDGHIAPIAAKISGNVVEVLVDNNWTVKAGQVLVRIDPRDYQVRVDQAKAALAVAESQARGAQVGIPLTRETTTSDTTGAEAQVAVAEADYNRARLSAEQAATSELSYARANLAAAEASNARAQSDLARMRPLAAKAEISQQQLDSYIAAASVAEAQWRAARDKVASAEQDVANKRAAEQAAKARVEQARASVLESRARQRQVTVSTAQASSATAAVLQAKANLEAAELQLSYTTITAPMDGQVTRKVVEVGQIVQPGQGLMTVIPLSDVWVTANFKETQLAHVRPGQKAEVHVDMYGQKVVGRVDSIAGATGAKLSLLPPENATGNFVKVVQRIPVKIVFDSLPAGVVLRPGMNVDATIFTK